ncbi:MAG: TylF/MycF family methyltransferase [bacterium]|nr:TylF/MycF family methyltransferase [bacterium]
MKSFENTKLISDQVEPQELSVIMREFRSVLDKSVPGDVIELGCYEGTTSLFLQRELMKSKAEKKLWLYDSFEGLPNKSSADSSPAGLQFKTGELLASKQTLISNFKKSSLPIPRIKKAWFSDLKPSDLPDKISFAFLDGDYYASIWDSLSLVWPKLSEGAVVIVDDYSSEALPGAAKAVNDWLKRHPADLKVESSLAVIYRH